MKKFLVFALVALVALVSCNKENKGGDDEKVFKHNEEEKAFKQTARMKTLSTTDVYGTEDWTYTYDAQGRVSKVVARWEGDVYATYNFNYSANKCEVIKHVDENGDTPASDTPFYDIDLNTDGLATKIKDYNENKTVELTYADGFIASAKIDGKDATQQSVTNECVDYWTRFNKDTGEWRHKEHTYTNRENVGAVHTEWAEDAGLKRWLYESGIVGRASRYCCATAQWADKTALAEYAYEYDSVTDAITKETKSNGEPGALEFDCEFIFTWEAIK